MLYNHPLMDGIRYDLLLTNAHVLTMDSAGTQHSPGFVAVMGSKIAATGPMDKAPPAKSAAEVMDCSGCVVLPGLINCHTHLPMVYFRGMADDLALMDWLNNHIWPAEQRFLTPDFVYQATQLAVAECIKSGVTCVNDMYIFAADVARACSDSGLRAYVGEGVIDMPTAAAADWRAGKRLTEELIGQYRDHPLITPTVCAHAPYTCPPEVMRELHGVAQDHGLLYHTHVHESEFESDAIVWGRDDESPLHSLKRIGVLGPRMVAAHCVWVSDHDVAHMHDFDCGVAHCPTSNMKLGNGIAPVSSMLEGNVAVGIGTDGAASNNNLNIWEEIHLAALCAKYAYKDPTVVPASQALRFATSRAARLLHDDGIGVLAEGKCADIVVVEMDSMHQTPKFNHPDAVYAQLVYSTQAHDVRDTIVNGNVLLRHRHLTRIDEAELMAKAQEWVKANF